MEGIRFLGRFIPFFPILLFVGNTSGPWYVWLPLGILSFAALDLYGYIYSRTARR